MNENGNLRLGTGSWNPSAPYWTGCTSSGRQALLGYANFEDGTSGILVIWFGSDGELQDTLPLSLAPGEKEPNGSTQATIIRKLPRWLADLGIDLAPIHICPFEILDDHEVFTRDLPRDLADHEDGEYGALYTDEERAELDRALSEWKASGNWVLVWGHGEFRIAVDGTRLF